MSDETINDGWMDREDDADAALDEARDELAESRATVAAARAEIVSMKREMDALSSQNAGLVRALERIGGRCDCNSHTKPGHDCVGTIARASLAASRSLASPGALMVDPGTVEACALKIEFLMVAESMANDAAKADALAAATAAVRALAAPPPLQEAPRWRSPGYLWCAKPRPEARMLGAFGYFMRDDDDGDMPYVYCSPACRDASRHVAGALQEAPTCGTWCGTEGRRTAPGEIYYFRDGRSFCSRACAKAATSLYPACAPPETERAPKCECDQHGENVCHGSADYLVTRAGKRIAVCDRCTLPGDGTEDRDLKPDWSKPRAIPAPKEPR